MTLVEGMILKELEAKIPQVKISEITLTLGTVPVDLQFVGGPEHVDLSAGGQTGSQVAAVVALPSGNNETWVVVAVLTSNADTDKDFAFIVTNGLYLQDTLQQGNVLKCHQVIDSEVASLQHYQVFCQVDTNQSGKVIPTKIILVEKQNNGGEVELHKVCLVIQGFFQPPRLDFDAEATYAPTADLTVLRLLLAKAASDYLAICQWDVKTAYLEVEQEVPILARLPKGLRFDSGKLCFSVNLCLGTEGNHGGQLVHLAKAPPGLCQLVFAWNQTLDKHLQCSGMERSKHGLTM